MHSAPEKLAIAHAQHLVLFCTLMLPLPEVDRDITVQYSTVQCGVVWCGAVPVYICHFFHTVLYRTFWNIALV